MKSNTNFNYVSKFKYLMLIPIILVLLAIVIGAIFGLNYDYDFRNVSTFDVKFNTTVSTDEYKELQNSLDSILSKEFLSCFRPAYSCTTEN